MDVLPVLGNLGKISLRRKRMLQHDRLWTNASIRYPLVSDLKVPESGSTDFKDKETPCDRVPLTLTIEMDFKHLVQKDLPRGRRGSIQCPDNLGSDEPPLRLAMSNCVALSNVVLA
jgi:hypothetical protein